MSRNEGIGGAGDLSALNQAQMDARWAAAQSGRAEAAMRQVAGAAEKAVASKGGVPSAEMAKLQKVSKDFESVFLAYLLKSMRQTVPKSDLLGDSQGSKIFGELRDEELAKNMASSGGIGLSRLLVEQLKRSLKG